MVRTKKTQVPLQPKRDKEVESFSVDVDLLRNTNRFDASHYNPRAAKAISMLKRCGMPLARLGDIAERVFIPPRFKRIYVEKEHGIPFIQGSHVVHFQPADLKYLSILAHKKNREVGCSSGLDSCDLFRNDRSPNNRSKKLGRVGGISALAQNNT